MVLYHGTDVKFSKFDNSFMSGKNFGNGFYFTEDFDIAKEFAHLKNEKGGFVLECRIHTNAPFDIRNKSHAKMLCEYLNLCWHITKCDKSYRETERGYKSDDYDEFYLKISNSVYALLEREMSPSWDDMHTEIHAGILALGFDSIVDPKRKYLMAFDSSQIQIINYHKIGPWEPK